MKPKNLEADDRTIYNMVVGRMLEAFTEKCIKDVTTVRATCGGVEFLIKGAIVKQSGWRAVYREAEENQEVTLPKWSEGDTLLVSGCSLTEGKTRPKPFHTEASLLSAMQSCGKEMESEELRQTLKECGIGTSATRASIIETLFRREYMVRQKKSLLPTEKGLALYSVVKAMRIADAAMTGEWELALSKIECGEMSAETFRKGIEVYASQITTELLTCDKLFSHKDTEHQCPKCGKGAMQFYNKVVRCSNPDCALPVFRQKAGKTLADSDITDLLTKGETGIIKGFSSKAGKSFSASVTFDADFNTGYDHLVARVIAMEMLYAFLSFRRTCLQYGRQGAEIDLLKVKGSYQWTGSIADLVELIYALDETKSINNGDVPITELAIFFGTILGVDLRECYGSYVYIKKRKNDSHTYFLDKMSKELNKRMERDDDREQRRK